MRTLLVLALCLGTSAASAEPEGKPSPQALVGTWKVDLRPLPDADPYYQEFVVSEASDDTLAGSFYGTPISNGGLNNDWGELRFAFVTGDGTGAYNTTGVVRGNRIEGTTHSVGRNFLSVWSAQRVVDSVETESGLTYEVIQEGQGPAAAPGKLALIHEVTRKADGTVITDTWARNMPIEFLVGGNQVIDGLDQAVATMRVGERRRLMVPPTLSQRTVYPDSIDPEDTLYYDVILLRVAEPR